MGGVIAALLVHAMPAHAQLVDCPPQVDLAKRDWDRAETLYKDEDISTSQHDQARPRVRERGE